MSNSTFSRNLRSFRTARGLDYPGYGNRGRPGDRIYAGSPYRPEGAVYGYAADGG